jgi:hypothetical protein
MKNFILGLIFGIVISGSGVNGIIRMVDSGVNKVKSIAQEQVK